MTCNCNCNCKNGTDVQDFLLTSPTAGVYVLGLTHYTCGNRKMLLADPTHPVIANLNVAPVGQPIDVGNAMYCQECQVTGTVTYCPCGSCEPRTEYVSYQCCLPTTSATQATLAIGTVTASPKPITYYMNSGCGCCKATKACTNQIALTTSIEVTAGA